MKNIVFCAHWTLLAVSIVSCCLLALVVSCEGTSKSIDGSSPGIAAPTQPPSALPKSNYVVPSSNPESLLDAGSTSAKEHFLNGSSAEVNAGVETSRATVDPDTKSHSVYSDDLQLRQTKGIESVPVAEIHSSFEDTVVETKQCISCAQDSEGSAEPIVGHTEGFSSTSGNGFAETKDASIVEGAVELNRGPEEKDGSKASFTPHVQIPIQLEKQVVDDNGTVGVKSEDVKESQQPNQESAVISRILTDVKDSERLIKVGVVESNFPKETEAYDVRAEPKVVDVKKADVRSSESDLHVKLEADENVTKQEKSVPDIIPQEPLSLDSLKSDQKIKVDGHPQDLVKEKDEGSLQGEHVPPESTSPTVPDQPSESSSPPPSASASEDMPSFSEWTQKRLEEAERRKVHNDTANQGNSDGSTASAPHSAGSPGGSSKTAAGSSGSGSAPVPGSSSSKSSGEGSVGSGNSVPGGSKVRQKNYASPDCGAKIASSNPEAVSPGSVLSPSRDEYLLNACASRIWFVVELCEAIRAKKIELANFELFSSSPREFSVWSSDRFPTRDWSLVGRFTAQDERTLQSFHLEPHLYAKFIRVELHSHYGSEHFCPVSLFRVYGTSEFEVLETEQEDGVNGVIGSGDPSGSLTGDDGDEDSDEEEPLDIETTGPPRNLFGSARDAVMSIVKKAAEALVKAGDSANETITLATESPIKEVPKNEASEPTADGEESESAFSSSSGGATECRTLRRPPVCVGCEESTILRAAALLSCHYDTLQPLTSSPFVRSALASGGLCSTRFGLPPSAANPSSSKPATDGGYISALLPVEYLVALCNALITPDMVRESDSPSLPDLPPIQPPTHSLESHTQTQLSHPHKHVMDPTMGGDSSSLSSMIKPTRTLKGDPARSGGQDESILEAGTHNEVSDGAFTGSTTVEVPQSTSMPSLSTLTSSSSFHNVEQASVSKEDAVTVVTLESAAAMKHEIVEPCKDWSEENEAGFQESLESEEATVVPPVTEPSAGTASPTSAPPSASTQVPPSSASSSTLHSSSEGLPSQGTQSPGPKGAEDPIAPPPPSPTTPTPPSQGHSKGQEANNIPNAAPTAAVMQKESVFVRLSNRIKTLERNMSLSAQYLEELSRRYRKQFEEAQKQAVEAQKRDRRLAEEAASLQARLDVLAEAVKGLLEARKKEEEERKKALEEEEAKRREEEEYGESFPWWGAILMWAWNTMGIAAVTVAQHALIFCVELMVLWAVMGHYQRRRWGWSGGASAGQLEAESQQSLVGDVQEQIKYGSVRKRRKWGGGLREDDWIESTESGRSPRKRKTTNEDVGLEDASEGLPLPELSIYQPHQKPRRRRRKPKSPSTASLSSCPIIVTFPSPSDTHSPIPFSDVPITQPLDSSPVENLNGWTWPYGADMGTSKRASLDEVTPVGKEDSVSNSGYSGRSSPKSNGDEAKEELGKVKSRRVSAPICFPEESGASKKRAETTSPLSRSSSTIHSSLRVCSPKLKGDNWEWFTGARVSGDLNSRGSRGVNRNGHSTLPSGDGASGSDTGDGRAGSSSPTPSGSSKNKDKKSGSSSSGGGGSSFKKIVKRFF
ncbi:SUN domain-containing ossification factor isoform X2 [Ischnura elegans]|uniref:SUN domain-containing ossification factor isoform X2 n=1 Tax=Ischnura elegans TaxID=197161 RepID=UPI001ED87A74|nr:SUN domain-containing ossification factor isoform X2 [Ischnura elegans]